jgi:thiaminase
MFLYAKIGQFLTNSATDRQIDLANHPYGSWIKTYADPAFNEEARVMANFVNSHLSDLTNSERQQMITIYRRSAELEYAFFDQVINTSCSNI